MLKKTLFDDFGFVSRFSYNRDRALPKSRINKASSRGGRVTKYGT